MRNNYHRTVGLTVLSFFVFACGAETGNRLERVPTDVASTVATVAETPAVSVSLIPVTTVSAINSSPATPYEEVKRPMISYLEKVIPPCIPVAGSEQDPCMPGVPSMVETASSVGSLPAWLYHDMPSFTEMLLGEFDDEYYSLWAPHIVVRGTVLPKTTRCELYPIRSFDLEDLSYLEGIDVYHCFADVQINEYIVGEGQPELTVSLHQESVPLGDRRDDWPSIKDEIIMNYLNDPQTRTAEAYEGRELVMFLQPNSSISIETWTRGWQFSMWFIQRVGDEIRAVASDIRYAFNDEQRARLDLPLAELVEELKRAAEERTTITGGRIGVSLSLPMFITDANKLADYYQVTGTKYYSTGGTTVLPPPVPGEDDPDPGTIPTDEGTTVTSVPVPGEETTVPPSTDDAGLTVGQDTTTTTEATTTAPTTTEVETPVTTESTSTVTTTAEAPETTTTTEATTTTTATATEAETPVTTESTPTVTTTAEETETTTTTTEPAPAETVTGTTTTTTVPIEEPSGEEVVPATDEPPAPGEESETTTSLTTTTTATPVDGDGAPGEETTTTIPTGDNGTAPANDGEVQPGATIPVNE